MPELRFDLANQEILDSGFYLKNTTMYSNLVEKTAAPSEVRQKTDRTDVDTEISYPMKISFLEFNPFIGSEHTHYTRTKAGYDDNVFRGQFKTGASLSTKFYRLFDVEFDQFGVEVNRLRHLVTPSIAYSYKADPTVPSSWLDQYDSIDELTNANTMNFSLENKLQTKRNDQTVDLLRFVLETDYRFHPHPGREGFEYITADIDFKPTDWLTFYSDTKFDVDNDRFKDANFDLYINNRDKWSFDIGKRWDRDVDDQLTTEFKYKLNRRMSFRAYNRFDLDSGVHKEQEYSIIRDLHSWDMELTFNETRNEGNEIYVLFRLKAFPDIKVDMGNGFNKRKSGTQSE